MQITTLLLTTLAALTTAIPSSLDERATAAKPWKVNDFGLHCSPGGCVYDFDIVAPGYPAGGAPPFSTTCHGTEKQGETTPCQEAPGVSAGFSTVNKTSYKLELIQAFTYKGQNYFRTGIKRFQNGVTPPKNFTIVPNAPMPA